MIARRCQICGIDWPDLADYIDCPKCETMTRRFKDVRPLDIFEAMSLKKHVEFDAFYDNVWLPEHPVESSHMPSMC